MLASHDFPDGKIFKALSYCKNLRKLRMSRGKKDLISFTKISGAKPFQYKAINKLNYMFVNNVVQNSRRERCGSHIMNYKARQMLNSLQ